MVHTISKSDMFDWFRRRGESQKGFSLIELMLALGGLTLLGVGVGALFGTARDSGERSKLRQTADSVRGTASNLRALQNSASANTALDGCLRTRNCNLPNWQFFELAGISPGSVIAGANVFYDQRSGLRCSTPGAGTCLMNVRAQFQGSGSVLTIRLVADKSDERLPSGSRPAYDPIITSVVSFDLREQRPAVPPCPPFQAMSGINPTTGNPICRENNLPAGQTQCPPGQAMRRLTAFGAAECFTPPARVDVTNQPAGFFNQNACGLGTFTWGECTNVTGLNGLFRLERVAMTCNWNSPRCVFVDGQRIPRTCRNCDPVTGVCTDDDCSYCAFVSSSTFSCNETRSVNRTAGPGAFECSVTRPTTCSAPPVGDCDSLVCDTFLLTSASGTMGCAR